MGFQRRRVKRERPAAGDGVPAEAGNVVPEGEASSDGVAVMEPEAAEVVVIPSSDDNSGHEDSGHEDSIPSSERYVVTEEDLDNIWETINKLASDHGDIQEAVTKLKRSLNKYMAAVVFKNGEEMEILSGALATLKSKVKALQEEQKKKRILSSLLLQRRMKSWQTLLQDSKQG
ncbi:unnamed protein product [Urochloa humidicola]